MEAKKNCKHCYGDGKMIVLAELPEFDGYQYSKPKVKVIICPACQGTGISINPNS